MTDRELLELAAKAAGYAINPHTNYKMFRDLIFTHNAKNWNPLEDDGDALRLAVKLGLEVKPYTYFNERCQRPATALYSGGGKVEDILGSFPSYAESFVEHDPYAATRRAIVRAAAEIGRNMK